MSEETQIVDPMIPEVAIELGGVTLRLSFDFEALAIAKAKLKEQGVNVNILRSLDFGSLDVDSLPALLFAAAHRHQPHVSWARVRKMVTLKTAEAIVIALFEAYKAAMIETAEDPQVASQTAEANTKSGENSGQ